MLKLSVGSPTVGSDGSCGYSRYRIDFENVDKSDRYALGWISPLYPTVEFIEYLERIKGWWTGWNREVWQDNVRDIQPFKVRLYRIGLKDDDLGLIEEQQYRELQPA
jgi:hypothetical protein